MINQTMINSLARLLHITTLLLFLFMPVWIAVSSLFTFLAGFFLVPFYIPIWLILRLLCRLLLRSESLPDNIVAILEKSIRRNSRALLFNIILSVPAIFLFVGHLKSIGKI
jgi:hypothetical protein